MKSKVKFVQEEVEVTVTIAHAEGLDADAIVQEARDYLIFNYFIDTQSVGGGYEAAIVRE